MHEHRRNQPRLHLKRGRVTHVLAASDHAPLTLLFDHLLGVFLQRSDDLIASGAALAASAVLTEGIPILEEAIAFSMASMQAVQIGDFLFVEFSGIEGRPRCVQASAFTQALLRCGAKIAGSAEETRSALAAWVTGSVGSHAANLLNGTASLALLERSASAGWAEVLPGYLLGDLAGEYAITPVSLATMARQHARGPLPLEASAWRPLAALDDIDVASAPDERLLDGLQDRIGEVLAAAGDGNLASMARRALQEMEHLHESCAGDPLADLMIEGTVGLLAFGTVRRDLPSWSIVRRYSREQIQAFRSDPQRALALMSMTGDERGQVYGEWWRQSAQSDDARAALRAFDLYLCANHDLEPARFANDDSLRWQSARAALLWPDEIQWLMWAIPRAARTPDIARVATAVAEIAGRRPVRPKDLRQCQRSDVYGLNDGQAIHAVRRRRGGLTTKTMSAPGPAVLGQVCDLPGLFAQKALMVTLAGRDGPLWGVDPLESARLFGEAVKLIGSLCRIATGDPTASFYTLRHSVFTHQLVDALRPGAWLADRNHADRLIRAGGHRHASTTMRHYFHLPMVVVRRCADHMLESRLSAGIAARWTRCT